MKKVNKFVKVISKILEIVHWVAAGIRVAAAICSAVGSQWLGHFVDLNGLENESMISVYGFEADIANAAGEVNMTTMLLFSIGAVIIFILVAMIFRNIHLIVKRSENGSPFQDDNIRMLREIGIFSIAIPVVGFIMSVIIRLVVGVDMVETSVRFDGCVMGLIVLCLTQFFIYGAELEKDVDGLL